jgi:hypothetical protein
MKSEQLKTQVLDILEEIKADAREQLVIEALSTPYQGLLKFLLKMVQKGKFQRNYDIDTDSGRMVFMTMGGKKVIFNDMKLGVTAFKTWKGKKDKEFFDYTAYDDILKWSRAG